MKKLFIFINIFALSVLAACSNSNNSDQERIDETYSSPQLPSVSQADQRDPTFYEKDTLPAHLAVARWREIEKLYNEYVRQLPQKAMFDSPIGTATGDQYVLDYRNGVSRSQDLKTRLSGGVDIDKKTIAFFMTYLLDQQKPTFIRAAFGKVPKSDVSEHRKNRYLVVFGLPKKFERNPWDEVQKKEVGLTPFELVRSKGTGIPARFYDDWNEVWP